MTQSRQRAASYPKPLRGRAARGLSPFLVVLFTSIGLLLATLSARCTLFDRQFGFSPAATTAWAHGHSAQACAADDDVASTDPTDLDDAGDSEPEGAASDDAPIDDDDDNNDVDEMFVQRLGQIPRASFITLLWHETKRLSGVIHTPEPRPARRV